MTSHAYVIPQHLGKLICSINYEGRKINHSNNTQAPIPKMVKKKEATFKSKPNLNADVCKPE